MKTECKTGQIGFEGFSKLGNREISVDDRAGHVSSDAGALLLREVAQRSGLLDHFVECFEDYRKPEAIEHSVLDLVCQRVYGLCLGYEDLNDHDRIRSDPLIATLVGKQDPEGNNRLSLKDRGKALAGKSTLNRLELTPKDAGPDSRYKKIGYNEDKVKTFFIDEFIRQRGKILQKVEIDVDPTDVEIHGQQESRFYHGYYGHYCYLPLYIFIGDDLVWSELRTSDGDKTKGTKEALECIVGKLRKRWPEIEILVRGDSDFSRDELMGYCEANGVDFIFGMAKNARLIKKLNKTMKKARRTYFKTLKAARRYKSFNYRTIKSWSRPRRIVGKAEYLSKGANPRFVVTSLSKDKVDAQTLYEKVYCARGDMENRIKEQQLGLFADRASSHTIRANQLRLAFSSLAYILMQSLRKTGLQGTQLQKAQVWTIRERLLKVGAIIKISVRRVWVQLSSHHPLLPIWPRILAQIAAAYSA